MGSREFVKLDLSVNLLSTQRKYKVVVVVGRFVVERRKVYSFLQHSPTFFFAFYNLLGTYIEIDR